MKTIRQLFSGIECDINGIPCDSAIDYITSDSRDIPTGGYPLFFAIKGAKCDANALVDGILAANGNAAIVSEIAHKTGIAVLDIRATMAIVAKRFYDAPDEKMGIFAVTGTDGKSTIGFLLRHFLDGCGLLGTIEYDVGGQILESSRTTPFALNFYKLLGKCAQNGCKNVALEASSHAIDQKRIFGLAVDVAIFTNLSHDHLDYHVTLERYFEAKKKLFTGGNGSLPKISIVNADDKYGLRLLQILRSNGQPAYGFGFSPEADFRITAVEKNSMSGSLFTLKYGNHSHVFATKLFGDHNISNITASLAAAKIVGHDFDQLGQKLEKYTITPGRLESIPLKNGAVAVIDYANTPSALETILAVLRKQPHRRVITVFGCGGERDRTKRAAMTEIAIRLSDYSIATHDNPRNEPLEQIFADMKAAATSGDAIEFIYERRAAMEHAIGLSQSGDIILIAGYGHENIHPMNGGVIMHFNDKEVTEEINASL